MRTEKHIIKGDEIKIEEMPQGIFLSPRRNPTNINILIRSPFDAELVIESLQRMLRVQHDFKS